MKNLTFIDLFAGCGGLSLGLEQAGFHPLLVNELNKDALSSYLKNREASHPYLREDYFHCNDVKELVLNKTKAKKVQQAIESLHNLSVKNGDIDLVVGGPPCQGYSGIGHRRSYSVDKEQLPSNHLYEDMAFIVSSYKPKIFLFENVKGLLSAKWKTDGVKGEIWEDVFSTFSALKDYVVNFNLVRAKDYGVAQNRPRVLLVGVRRDIYKRATSVLSTSAVAEGFLPEPSGFAPNLFDLLGDLVDPKYENGGSTTAYPQKAKNETQQYYRTMRNGNLHGINSPLTEHEYSNHAPHVIEKFTYMLRNNGEIPPHLKTKKFAQRLLPKVWGKEGPTITATSLPDDYVHFSQPRILTVREWARLQGFPDYYEFSGSRTTGGLRRAGNPRIGVFDRELPKYTQIGNAVPVLLASAVGEHFKKILSC
jgi:DNA (cytosine-5)-methyltransferase 1